MSGAAAAPSARGLAMPGLGRLDGASRVRGVDLARGLAVLGMVAAHLLTFDVFEPGDPATWIDVVSGRSSILFALLAGVSIGLVSGGPRPVAGAALTRTALRLVVRAVLLYVLGLLLIATGVPVANILPAYALLFLLALPFLRVPARVLLPLAGVLAVVTPLLIAPLDTAAGGRLAPGASGWALTGWEYPFVAWIAFVLAGLGLARSDVRRLRTQVGMLVGGALIAAAAYGVAAAVPAPAPWLEEVWTAEAHSSGILEIVGSGGFAIAVLGLGCLVCRTVTGAVLLPLRAVGSMPLTAYTGQILVWWVVAALVVGDVNDLLAARALGLFWYLAAGILVACTAWALLVGRGPLEGLVDRVARTFVPPPTPPTGQAAAHRTERIDA